ncbi:hypothetical protein BV25DRAFT_1831154 [Artomyces pyxidatus]|uniref:Uncharacterized protein n=1 Tax=Artomyces pyxidatus TaxID=48021 RepID=A0ACB8SP17_9AGAM|nr:hypothetical protein BV25DRAFT_1831154 [Artomyces pyxidatus]
MPLALLHRGYSVYISCEGKEIPQYQVEVVDEKTLRCYIPSEAGKKFIVHYDDVIGDSHTSVRVYSDGRYMYGMGCEAGQYDLMDGVRTSPTTISPFQFSKVVTTSDDEVMTDVDITQLGTIEVRVKRAVLKANGAMFPHDVHNVADIGPIPEVTKTAGYNQVSLSKDVEIVHDGPSRVFSTLGSWDDPYAVFQFRHRPAEMLQAMGIMPLPKHIEEELADDGSVPTGEKRAKHPTKAASKGKKKRKGSKLNKAVVSLGCDEVNNDDLKAIALAERTTGRKCLRILTRSAQDDLDMLEQARLWFESQKRPR